MRRQQLKMHLGVLPEVNLKFGNKQMAKKDKRFKFIRMYSSVPDRSANMFINFEETFSPAQSYFGLHIY